jgi:hypothetical protein
VSTEQQVSVRLDGRAGVCPACQLRMSYEEDRDPASGEHLQRPWWECGRCGHKEGVGVLFRCGCGLPKRMENLVCQVCWKAAPYWMRRNVASRHPNQKREAREKLLAFAIARKPEAVMQRLCGWCGVDLGTKEGDGVTYGICPKCAEAWSKEAGI